jgi:hypothetical protein
MDLVLFQHDQSFVLDRFCEGEFDYVDGVSEVEETEFFRYIGAHKVLPKLAESYPSPREKEEVPLWLYIASNLSMRLHGVHSFHAYPYVVRCGGMLNAFGPQVAHKARHPETQDVTLSCGGFNEKNTYDRQTPCDQDFLRKLSRDTLPEQLERWFNFDVMGILKQHKAFDPEGIFLGDASYLFVPDNENYEGSVRMLFDEHYHPMDKDSEKKLTAAQRARCQWKRCYKLVSLIHTNRRGDFFLYAAVAVVSGKAHECPVLYRLVDDFVQAVGRGTMKRLILDRGFLDGEQIGRCKQDYGIDVLIPLKKNMDVYKDVLGLMRGDRVHFQPYTAPAPKLPVDSKPTRVPAAIRRREKKRQETLNRRKENEPSPPPDKTVVRTEIAAVGDFRSWSSCPVPLSVIINKEIFADGHEEIWMLVDTKAVKNAAACRDEYRLRTGIEERHRQLKCFLDLTDFKSRAFSLVVNQVIFVALAYSLLQLYLRRIGRPELNRRTTPRIRRQLMPTNSVIILYYQNRFALLSALEYTSLVLNLSEKARKKVLAKTQQLERELAQELALARAP